MIFVFWSLVRLMWGRSKLQTTNRQRWGNASNKPHSDIPFTTRIELVSSPFSFCILGGLQNPDPRLIPGHPNCTKNDSDKASINLAVLPPEIQGFILQFRTNDGLESVIVLRGGTP